LAQGIPTTKALYRVKNLNPRELPLGIDVGGDPFAEVPRGDSGFSKHDRHRVDFGIIADTHGPAPSEVVSIHRNHDDFIRLLYEYRADLLGLEKPAIQGARERRILAYL
jgi:hypothetical protein